MHEMNFILCNELSLITYFYLTIGNLIPKAKVNVYAFHLYINPQRAFQK